MTTSETTKTLSTYSATLEHVRKMALELEKGSKPEVKPIPPVKTEEPTKQI